MMLLKKTRRPTNNSDSIIAVLPILVLTIMITSLNMGTGEWGYLGKEGNEPVEDVGYGLGALANLPDIVALFGGGTIVDYVVQKKDATSHAAVVNKNENINISVGPVEPRKFTDPIDALRLGEGKIWKNYSDPGKGWHLKINNVNKNLLVKMTENINNRQGLYGIGKLRWNVLGFSCGAHASRALWAVGVPNLGGIHPYFLYTQLAIRQAGIYASPYIINY